VATHLGRQADDLWGVVLLVLGLLAALGIYANLTGPAGRAVRDAARELFGWGRFLVPPALGAVGGVLLRGRHRDDPARVAIGSLMVVGASIGLLDLAGHHHRIGGVLGAAVGEPLRSLLAVWGAALLLLSLLLVGLLVATRTPARTAAHHTAAGVRPLGRLLRRALAARPRPEMAGAVERHPSSAPVEVVDEAETAASTDDEPDEAEHDPAPREPRLTAPAAMGPVGQLAIDLGPASAPGPWRLPPLQLLKRGKAQEVDRRVVDARGRVLED